MAARETALTARSSTSRPFTGERTYGVAERMSPSGAGDGRSSAGSGLSAGGAGCVATERPMLLAFVALTLRGIRERHFRRGDRYCLREALEVGGPSPPGKHPERNPERQATGGREQVRVVEVHVDDLGQRRGVERSPQRHAERMRRRQPH